MIPSRNTPSSQASTSTKTGGYALQPSLFRFMPAPIPKNNNTSSTQPNLASDAATTTKPSSLNSSQFKAPLNNVFSSSSVLPPRPSQYTVQNESFRKRVQPSPPQYVAQPKEPRKEDPRVFQQNSNNTQRVQQNQADFSTPACIRVNPEPIDADMLIQSAETVITLPEGCKLYRIYYEHMGVSREFVIPMLGADSLDDVMKNMPPLSEITSSLLAKEKEEQEMKEQAENPKEEVLVNPKQFDRIMKRRKMRERLLAAGRIPAERRKYLHESRHRHALSRVRGEDGRFDKKAMKIEDPTSPNSTSPSNQQRVEVMQKERQYTQYVNIKPAPDVAHFEHISAHHVPNYHQPIDPMAGMMSQHHLHQPQQQMHPDLNNSAVL